MNSARTCTRCGTQFSDSTVECPRCLLEIALGKARVEGTGSVPNFATGPAQPRPDPPTEDEIVRAFPGFEGFELIGRGGMGVVYKARQKKLQRLVALKVLPRAFGADPAFRERFLREARALARLVHQNIVAVHEFGESGGLFFLVLEFVDGVNLRQAMREKQLEPREALSIVRSLCDALQYAHDEGVVHRDIKPENVLLDRAGRVKIADFGLAKVTGIDGTANLTAAGQVMGTPHYMAPEQIERPQDVDHRADLFALGVVMYEMLTGSLPRGVFELPSTKFHLDVRLDEIVLKALEREPSRRYQHAVEVKTDVEHVEAGPAESMARKSPAAKSTPPVLIDARENPLRGLRGLALCAGLWIVIGVLWNLGAFALGFALPMAFVIAGLLLHTRLRAMPELSAHLAGLTKSERARRRLLASVVGCVALAAIFVAQVSGWDQGTRSWSPAWPSVHELTEGLRADPLQVALESKRDEYAERASELVVGNHDKVRTHVLPFGLPVIPMYAFGGVALILALYLSIRPTAREHSRAAWHASVSIAAQILGSLAVLWVAVTLVALRSQREPAPLIHSLTITAALDVVTEELLWELAQSGLQVDVEQDYAVVAKPIEWSGTGTPRREPLGNARFIRAEPNSPFERWKLSLAGPQRAVPQIWAIVRATGDWHYNELEFYAGRYDLEAPEAQSVRALLTALGTAARGK